MVSVQAMGDYGASVLLGVLEGLTEFLPVSSTAHLRLAEWLFDLGLSNGYWKTYAIVIQLGAVLSLPLYFRRRIAGLVATFPHGRRRDRPALTHPLTLVLMAFAATAAPAFLLAKMIGKHLESLDIMGGSLLLGGVAMWIVDARNAPWETAGPRAPGTRIRTWRIEAMDIGQAIWIGLCQLLSAVFPGTSRSMSTIAGAQLAGMSRVAALEFSFFLSLPTMVVATLYQLVKSLPGSGGRSIVASAFDLHGWLVLAIGFVVSFLVAYASVAWMMNWVRNRTFAPFAIYRIVLGTLVLLAARRWAS